MTLEYSGGWSKPIGERYIDGIKNKKPLGRVEASELKYSWQGTLDYELIERQNVRIEGDVLKRIESLDINSKEFAKVFHILADKVADYSKVHSGYVPRDLFIDRLRIAGQYPCVEILLVDYDGIPLLARREDPNARGGEVAWLNSLHIPGMAVTSAMNGCEMLEKLLNKEIVKEDSNASEFARRAELIGVSRQYEEERGGVIADTPLFVVKVDSRTEGNKLDPSLARFDGNMDTVIPEHRKIIDWYKQGDNRPLIFDTRG